MRNRNSVMAVPERLGLLAMGLWLVTGTTAVLIALLDPADIPTLEHLLRPLEAHVAIDKAMYSPLAYFILFSLTFLLESSIPARRQAVLSSSLFQDGLWYIATVIFRITVLAAYTGLLVGFYQQHLSELTIEAARDWHPAVKFLAAFLVTDFFRWLSHLIAHKVPIFWEFHAIHHSQRDLNLFTDARVHPVDRMVAGTIKFIPALMLDNALPVIMAWAVFETVYPKFYHANVRLALGPLRFILVTPQSHRVHHGIGEKYRDKNFDFTLSIWDWLFGTQYPDHTVYPETGIPDPDFPAAAGETAIAKVTVLIRQLVYPFIRVARMLGLRVGKNP